jgi:hypothetical protein
VARSRRVSASAPWPAAVYWLALPLLVAAFGLAARRLHGTDLRTLAGALDSRRAPLAVAAVTSLFLAWVWGSFAEPAFIHDEAAYLLQAEIFASGRVSGAPPPLPEFFEQYHVLLTPRLAPKYPPGHAILLVPGVWLGLPGLIPVLLYGVAAGFFFATSRRLAGAWVALLAWVVWLSAPEGNIWRCTYLSESTSTAAWMLGGWLLLTWWERGRTRDLVGIAVLTAWLGVTRPLTAVAFAVPVAVLVLAGVRARGGRRPLLASAAAGAAVLALLPLWSRASTGSWSTLPYTHYSRVYFPYEKLGFGLDTTPPRRELPPDMIAYDRDYRRVHIAYTLDSLPRAVIGRVVGAQRDLWGGSDWRPPLLLFFLAGLAALDRRGWFAMAWAPALLLVYLAYAHPPQWGVYYHEVHPALAFVTALGLWRALSWLAAGSWNPDPEATPRSAFPAAALTVLALALALSDAVVTKRQVHERVAYHRAFAQVVATIPEPRALVFVRYQAGHNPHRSLIANPSDYTRARVWLVYDRGPDNRRLLHRTPDRAPYLFDEATFTLSPLPPGP